MCEFINKKIDKSELMYITILSKNLIKDPPYKYIESL